MSLRPRLRPTTAALRPRPVPTISARAYSQSKPRGPSSGSGSGSGPSSGPKAEHAGWNKRTGVLPKALLYASILPVIAYWFRPGKKALNPQSYSEHEISDFTLLSPRHAALSVPLGPDELRQFAKGAFPFPFVGYAGSIYSVTPDQYAYLEAQTRDDTPGDGSVVVQHVMLRNPAIQIERHYTPVNDVARDGRMELVVKRVTNGELGRMVFGLKAGDSAGFRGPVTTFALRPEDYDTVVMVSTGTAVAPFLQLLAKAPAGSTKYRLLHAAAAEQDDWSAPLLAARQAKFGDKLDVRRIPAGPVQKADVQAALKDAGRVCVLVCLPPRLMGPLCGPLTPTLEQGPLAGTLRELGLDRTQVWKLE